MESEIKPDNIYAFSEAIHTCPVTVYSLLYQPLDAMPMAENMCLRLSPGFCNEYSM